MQAVADEHPTPVDANAPDTRSDIEILAALARGIIEGRKGSATLSALAGAAASLMPEARWAGLSRAVHGGLVVCAASDRAARDMDATQCRLGTGPSVSVLAADRAECVTSDLAADGRWPELAAQAHARGVRGVLAARVVVSTVEDCPYVVTFYADQAAAFDGAGARDRADRCVALMGLAVAAVVSREQARNLTVALTSNREIGVGMGVLMARHRIERSQAFDLLRIASQRANRKLRDVASEVADTGTLELPPARSPRLRARDARADEHIA
ncbi:ANTAR domain-containing protein [Jatrophihabitans sp. YIM 134969]